MISPELMTAQVLSEDDVVDRVMAIVGDSIILQTEVQEELQRMAMSGGITLPDPGPELDQMMSQVLDQIVNRTLVLQEAARDTLIRIEESEIEDRVTSELMKLPSNSEDSQGYNRHLKQMGLTLLNTVTYSERKFGKNKRSNFFCSGAFRAPRQLSCLRMTCLSHFRKPEGNYSNVLRLSHSLK